MNSSIKKSTPGNVVWERETYDVVCALPQLKQPSEVSFEDIVEDRKLTSAHSYQTSTVDHGLDVEIKNRKKP